jgi:hypothetical protein
MEARVFQKNFEVGIDRLLESHIPGNGIPRKTGSKRAWKLKTRNTSWTGVF